MKGKSCYIALLLLSIISIPTFCVFSDVNALKHEYDGITITNKVVPLKFTTDESGNSVIDWSYDFDSYDFDSFGGFSMGFYGDSYYDELSDLHYSTDSSYFNTTFDSNSNSCGYLSGPLSIFGTFSPVVSGSSTHMSFGTAGSFEYYSDSFVSSYILNWHCKHSSPFGSAHTPPFNTSTLPGLTTTIPCNDTTGAVCGAVRISTSTYLTDKLLPDYWFTYAGFYTHSTAIDTDSGIHYNHSFSFDDIFNQNFKKFSKLELPMYNYDDSFWLDGSNFTAGRQLEWKGAFVFDDSVSFHENIDSNGSVFEVLAVVYNPTLSQTDTLHIPCVLNLRTVPDANDFRQIEYSCSTTLSYQTPFLIPTLVLRGANNGVHNDSTYIWYTEGDWRWAGMYLVTDNDETPGESFNSNIPGKNIPGSVTAEDMSDGNEDWFSSLTNLFNFNFINPFAPIFQLFTNQSTCASIPTLASMLHSNETQVCPWFDNTTRAIVTPVLGIASVMLVFGFAVRWLGSSSGNLFEDSHETDNYNFSNKFRRKRG